MLREGNSWVFPAIAIPVENKDEFACPKSHVAKLEQLLRFVTKTITVGWRATEADFLRMLQSQLTGQPELMIVSGDHNGGEQTFPNIIHSPLHYSPNLP